MTEYLNDNDHVGDVLSGFIDGELTQQDAQRVRIHLDRCDHCRIEHESLVDIRRKVGEANLSNVHRDVWREGMNDKGVKATRGIGWLLFLGGILVAAGVVLYELVTSDWTLSLTETLIVGGVYGGLLLLFISVLRQRLIERKTDKYKDVEI